MQVQEFKLRREKLVALLPDNSVTLLYSGVAKKGSADGELPFLINRNFYYLTGIEQPNSALIIVKSNMLTYTYLSIDQREEKKEKWFGISLDVDEAKAISGIENILFSELLPAKIETILNQEDNNFGELTSLYMDLEPENKIAPRTTTLDLAEQLGKSFNFEVEDVHPLIVKLRMVKSPLEIAELRQAIATTNTGIQAILSQIKPGMHEYQLSALFKYVIADKANAVEAFPTIAASGKNAVILHYPNPKAKLQDGTLMLFDLGADSNLYCADISRTFPVSGSYNPLQATIYSIVLGANKAVIEMIKPGLTLADLQQFTREYLTRRLLDEGLIKTKDQIDNYYYHSVSHHLGLDTHDPADRQRPLEAGNVITVEPGLYFKEYGIGVRIEDDVLVTPTGSECLSKAIIKEISDIEKVLSKRK